MKTILNIVGLLALLLALAGVFLPLLPTTPFLLLASACFMRGSKTLHAWLMQAPVFGKHLQDYHQHRVIPLRAKILALCMLWPSLLYAAFRFNKPPLQLLLLFIGLGVSAYLLRHPSTRKSTHKP